MRTTHGPPWLGFYGAVPPTLDSPDRSLWDAARATASRLPDAPALAFLGVTTTVAAERCVAALHELGG